MRAFEKEAHELFQSFSYFEVLGWKGTNQNIENRTGL